MSIGYNVGVESGRAYCTRRTLRQRFATCRLLGQRVCRRGLGARRMGLTCRTISTVDLQNCRNKARMYMKTKEEVKKSSDTRRVQGVGAALRRHRTLKTMQVWRGKPAATCRRETLDSSTPEINERSENVYENKGQGQNVIASRDGCVFHTRSSDTHCDNPMRPVLESRFSNNGRPIGGTR